MTGTAWRYVNMVYTFFYRISAGYRQACLILRHIYVDLVLVCHTFFELLLAVCLSLKFYNGFKNTLEL